MRSAWIFAGTATALAFLVTLAWRSSHDDALVPADSGVMGTASGEAREHVVPPPAAPQAVSRRHSSRDGVELSIDLDFQCGAAETPTVVLTLKGPGGTLEEQCHERASWSGMGAGSYRLTATAKGWYAEPLDFELGANDRELSLPMHPEFWLAGVVLDRASRATIPDFELKLQERQVNSGIPAVGLPFSPQVPNGPDGCFCIAHVPGWGEEWRLIVSSPQHDAAESEWFRCESQHSGLVVPLERKGSTFAAVQGRVLDQAGAPISGARLALVAAEARPSSVGVHEEELWFSNEMAMVGEDGGVARADEARALSGSDGAFAMRTSRGGRAKVVAYAPGRRLTWSDPFELDVGGEVDVGLLTLAGGASLRGEVIPELGPSASNDRIEPRTVTVELLGGSPVTVSLDSDLTFAFDGLDPGMYRLSVQAEVLVSLHGDEREMMRLTEELVHLEAFESKYVVLSGGADVTGVSVRGTLSVPDERLTRGGVMLLGEDGLPLRIAILREDGSFVVPDVPVGRFTLAAIGQGANGTIVGINCVDLEVDAGSTPDRVSLALDGMRLEIREPEQPQASIAITADTGSAALDRFLAGGQIRTNEEGRAEFLCLPAGGYEFRIGGEVRSAVVSAETPSQVIVW